MCMSLSCDNIVPTVDNSKKLKIFFRWSTALLSVIILGFLLAAMKIQSKSVTDSRTQKQKLKFTFFFVAPLLHYP